MDIVDAQIHLWQAKTPDRPWPPGRAHEAQKPYPMSKETVLFQMDLAGVRRAVLAPPSWKGDRLLLFACAFFPLWLPAELWRSAAQFIPTRNACRSPRRPKRLASLSPLIF